MLTIPKVQIITKKINNILTNSRKINFQSKDTFELSEKIKLKPKDIISKVLGGNQKICRDFTDLGNFYSAKKFFVKPTMHYISIDPQKSTKTKTFISNHISCYYDKNKQLEKFYVLSTEDKSIKLFSKTGTLIKAFTSEETEAMLRYKSTSKKIHKILRGKEKIKDEAQIQTYIKNLSNLFQNGKAWKTEKDMVVYRALDKDSLNKIMSMPRDGLIFEDPSFMSVATKKSSTYPFLNLKNFNHIVEIRLPENTQYLKLDDIGHIVVPQASENEMVLKNGSKLIIKSRNGMVKAEYYV